MEPEVAERLAHAEFQIAALYGHRIAIDTLVRTVIIDLYANVEDGAERFAAAIESEITAMHGIMPEPVGLADAEYVKQQALHSLEGLCQSIPNAIRQRRGEPLQRPD